jgi:hypothetical protein
MLTVLLLLACAAWGVTGWQLCCSRHRQKGMETDHLFDSPADLLPGGSPLFVPDDWDEPART